MIPDWWTSGGATSESDTERDGFISYSTEGHAVVIAIATGWATGTIPAPEVLASMILLAFGLRKIERVNRKVAHEIKREPWYFAGFALATYAAVRADVLPTLFDLVDLGLELVDVVVSLGAVL